MQSRSDLQQSKVILADHEDYENEQMEAEQIPASVKAASDLIASQQEELQRIYRNADADKKADGEEEGF